MLSQENLVTGRQHSALLFAVNRSSLGRRIGLWLMALLLLSAGTAHFLWPRVFVQIVPPAVPWPAAAVYVSGGCELVLGVALLIPAVSRLAALGVVLLLVAIFPANVYHWLANVPLNGQVAPGWYHAIRLPGQALLIAWAFWLSRPPSTETARPDLPER